MVNIEQARFLVRLAREAIENYLRTSTRMKTPKIEDEELKENRGVFCTLKRYPDHSLRGCIGFPYPIRPLVDAVIDASISAAVEDPRFPPLMLNELTKIVIELSILTVPEKIYITTESDADKLIRIGKDGLIVKWGPFSGLLLPQVAVEEGWNSREFLSHTCWKAGLPLDMWLREDVEVYRFQAQIFQEEEPEGRVLEKPLSNACGV